MVEIQLHIEVRPEALAGKFHMAKDRNSIGGGGGDYEVIFRQPGGGAIIHGDAIFAQHQTVTGLADSQFGETIAINLV